MSSFPELSQEFDSFSVDDLKDDRTVVDWLFRALTEEQHWDTPGLPDRDFFAVAIGRARGWLTTQPPSDFPPVVTLYSNDPLLNAWMERGVEELHTRTGQSEGLPEFGGSDPAFGAWLVESGVHLLTKPEDDPVLLRALYAEYTTHAATYLDRSGTTG